MTPSVLPSYAQQSSDAQIFEAQVPSKFHESNLNELMDLVKTETCFLFVGNRRKLWDSNKSAMIEGPTVHVA